MKRLVVLAVLASLVAVPVCETRAQGEPTGQKTLAATMGVYVFPTEGQAKDQQSQEEATCYNWAVQNTGTDPFELAKKAETEKKQAEQAKKEAQKAGQGAGAQGAVRGAAAGALIGEIASDDAGKGAAYGAAAGLLRGRRRGRQAKKKAEGEAENQAQQSKQATQQQMESFKKAFSVCLEAKKYMVKF